uniref:Uncharacterized protein n=1 Tax=Sphaeramia orbicularis TaxID=375764 RepID=A0A672Y9I0_9TELE
RIMGQAKVMSHFMSDGRGESYRAGVLECEFVKILKTDSYVTNWALSCFTLFRRSVWRHIRKLSRVASEFKSTSILFLFVQISKPTSMMRIFRARYTYRKRKKHS